MRKHRAPHSSSMKPIVIAFAFAGVLWLTGCSGLGANANGGTNSGGNSAGTLALGSRSLNFGNVPAGSSKSLNIAATNSGHAAVTISSVAVSTKYFSVTAPSLPVTIAPGQSAVFIVVFTPNSAGTFNATATVITGASTSALNLTMTGTGTTTAVGQLTVNPSTLAVGNVVDGSSATAQGSLTATGASLTVTTATSNNSAFVLGGLSLPVTISAGQSISFDVTFSPLTSGAATATLTFSSNAQSSNTTATLTGTGTAAPTHSVALSWISSNASNVVGYNIYRANYGTSCGQYSQVNSVLDTSTLYTDSSVADGASYCYASTAVNTGNEESTYSNIVSNVKIPSQ